MLKTSSCPAAIIEEANAVALPTRAYLATVLRPNSAYTELFLYRCRCAQERLEVKTATIGVGYPEQSPKHYPTVLSLT